MFEYHNNEFGVLPVVYNAQEFIQFKPSYVFGSESENEEGKDKLEAILVEEDFLDEIERDILSDLAVNNRPIVTTLAYSTEYIRDSSSSSSSYSLEQSVVNRSDQINTVSSGSSNSTDESLSLPQNTTIKKTKGSKKRKAPQPIEYTLPSVTTFYAKPTVKALQSEIDIGVNSDRSKLWLIPRILKNDIRRQYAKIFANVYNSGNYEFMRSYLHRFYRTDADLALHREEYSSEPTHYKGLDLCAKVFYEAMNDAPDLVFSLDSTQIKIRADGKGTVRSCFRISGTKMLTQPEYDMLEEVREELEAKFQGIDLQSQDNCSNSLPTVVTNTKFTGSDPKDYWLTPSTFNSAVLSELGCRIETMERARNPEFDQFIPREEFLKTFFNNQNLIENIPIKFAFEGYFELFLDENAYIHAIDFCLTQ